MPSIFRSLDVLLKVLPLNNLKLFLLRLVMMFDAVHHYISLSLFFSLHPAKSPGRLVEGSAPESARGRGTRLGAQTSTSLSSASPRARRRRGSTRHKGVLVLFRWGLISDVLHPTLHPYQRLRLVSIYTQGWVYLDCYRIYKFLFFQLL